MVNVASECGFTEEHYKDLQQLQRDFGPYHFNVLAFPCNQFGQQEPGSDKDIDNFVRRVYGVSFPLFSKIAVVGTGANNVYKHLVGELCVFLWLRDMSLFLHYLKFKHYKDCSLHIQYISCRNRETCHVTHGLKFYLCWSFLLKGTEESTSFTTSPSIFEH